MRFTLLPTVRREKIHITVPFRELESDSHSDVSDRTENGDPYLGGFVFNSYEYASFERPERDFLLSLFGD